MSSDQSSIEDTPHPLKMTLEMVRKRSEHNEGVLGTMEEIAMHQDTIGEITNVLERYCPHLKIVYLQNNYIEKIQHLSQLHELEYLNLALNNISTIEGLEGCEKLNKLDLTCNFIVDLFCIQELEANPELRELHLLGNPCQKFEGYREFVIATLPNLQVLDGTDITPEERIIARRKKQALTTSILNQIATCDSGHWTREERMKAWAEIEHTKQENKKPEPKGPDYNPIKKIIPPVPVEGERVIQGNTGHWKFKWYQEDNNLCLEVACGRYLSVELINVFIDPHWVRVEAKGDVLQLQLPNEVMSHNYRAVKAMDTGHLVLYMPLVDPSTCFVEKFTRK